MPDLDVAELLREASLLEELTEEDLFKVSGIASVQNFDSAINLFQEGAVCERLYLVSTGLVALDMCLPRRGCARMVTVGPGEIIGWSALLADARMTAKATVVEPSTLIVFRAGELRALCDADHDIGYAVMKHVSIALSRRLLATRLQMLDVFEDTQPVIAPAIPPSASTS